MTGCISRDWVEFLSAGLLSTLSYEKCYDFYFVCRIRESAGYERADMYILTSRNLRCDVNQHLNVVRDRQQGRLVFGGVSLKANSRIIGQ